MKYSLLFIFLLTPYISSERYEINTSSGITIGFEENKVMNWDDIPYAQPPIANLRWKAPREIINSSEL